MRRLPAYGYPTPRYPRRIPAGLLAAVGAVSLAPVGQGCWTVGDMPIIERGRPDPFENQPDPCVELEPEVVDFGEVELGSLPTVEVVVIRNPCEGDLEIYDLGLGDETSAFYLGPLDTVLVPDHTLTDVWASFLADREGDWHTSLWVETNDPELPVAEIQLLGTVVPELDVPGE